MLCPSVLCTTPPYSAGLNILHLTKNRVIIALNVDCYIIFHTGDYTVFENCNFPKIIPYFTSLLRFCIKFLANHSHSSVNISGYMTLYGFILQFAIAFFKIWRINHST